MKKFFSHSNMTCFKAGTSSRHD